MLTSASAGWKIVIFYFPFLCLCFWQLYGRRRKHLIYDTERSRNSLFNHFSWAFNYTLLVWVVSEWNLWKTKRIKCLTSSCCPTAGHTYTLTRAHTHIRAKIKWKKCLCVCVCKNKIKISPLISVIIMCERILIMKQANGRKAGQ